MISNIDGDIRKAREQQQANMEKCQKTDYDLNEKIVKNNQDINYIQQVLNTHK